MARFIFFTKTRWDETPRLRHQLAGLLADAGHEVVFFEKPGHFWARPESAARSRERIEIFRHAELIHHRLRLTSVLQRVNAVVTGRSITARLRPYGVTADDTIVSFNYDYWFLRKLFPRNQIITVINDDFICVALFGYTRPLLWALARTAGNSDRVLTVSVPLQRQLAPYCEPELFLPWADRPYQRPAESESRDTLLFWGYTNRRIEFDAVKAYAERLLESRPGIRLLFVGPIYPDSTRQAESLAAISNIEFQPPSSLDDLPLDRVLAAWIPYRPGDLEVDAITLSNKGLQLLARGLPILISALPAMPHFIDAPFVHRMDLSDPGSQIDRLRGGFDSAQPAIAAFVAGNTAEARLKQFFRTEPQG